MSTALNFNPGPAMLPPTVLEKVQAELRDYQGRGMSIMEMSHRSKEYEAVNAQAEASLKRLLGVGDGYRALFVQGGASTQFAMVPMNFLPPGGTADYLINGSWGEKAYDEAVKVGQARVVGSTKDDAYRRVPHAGEIKLSPDSAYVHLTSNETIQGVQWHAFPDVVDRPLVADMSSDILSRPIDAGRFSLIYAGAQKNLGPSGVTVVLILESWLERANKGVPTMLRYATHVKNNSLYNTPPTFGVYVLNLVLQWVDEIGGLAALAERNARKAAILYDAIDGRQGFYRGHAAPDSRSSMNVTFRLPSEALEKKFLAEAQAVGMVGLPGHRSVGGCRASIYNAMSVEGCQALASLMDDFARRNG
ncbi:MAG: 3-phosphoserine/phosphohydroxythreonine transaminase [Planctomycetaceae bacterium]|nr:3-phosphoserine/phosphohydroxythreonine transaminase [Planctomycetaceae bacterium]MBV8557955.1 3-phosphoserine/phosphohydroxythreonine transaminase [Planctomycetaceae bacterium]